MEPGEWVVQRREATGIRWVGGASDKRQAKKALIESEWTQWQTGLAEQQAYAEIDPWQDKKDEDDHTNTDGFVICLLSALHCRVGRRPEAMRRHPNQALPLGPGHRTARPPWPEAASGASAKTSPSCGIVSL